MAVDLKVVELPSSLTDIPAMLRNLADEIERGNFGDVPALFAVMPREQGYPAVFGWGAIGENDPIVEFELAKAFLVNQLVARR